MTRALLKTFGADAVLFNDSDAHFDHAVNALSVGDHKDALEHFKHAFENHAQQSIITRVYNEANYVNDPLLKTDYLAFVAQHSKIDEQKNQALNVAIQTLGDAARGNVAEVIPHEAIATRILDVLELVPSDFNGILQRGSVIQLWHTQVTAMLQRDELAGTHNIKTFLGTQAVNRAVTGLDDVTAGVIKGAVARVLAEQKHAALISRATARQILAAHNTPTGKHGKPTLN